MIKSLKKINYNVVGIIVILILFNSLIFFISKLFIGTPHLIGTALDTLTPFLPGFVYIYIAWYISLVVIPYYIYIKDKNSFNKYVITYLLSSIICGIIFVVYPNTIQRAEITGTGITNWIIKVIYFLDYPVNCLPSIHCLYSFLYIFAIFDTKNATPLYVKILITIFSIAVVFSTLFIKQHVIYDAVASLIISVIVWTMIDKFKIYKYVNKIYEKKVPLC